MPTLAPPSGYSLISRPVKLQLAQGLHIRACSRVVALVGQFQGQIRIRCGERCADASSMFDLIQLVAVPGSELILEGEGDGAESVLDSLEQFLSQTTEPKE
ncbi:HPr family phosphocarrier protein [Planctomicrobium sp. SH661]|uniref:HPr family phosphocarrier protein n=1 Tax=Planctomicrobium sp. SH661 TaxID=3448124 RepID=UPI003F5C19E7